MTELKTPNRVSIPSSKPPEATDAFLTFLEKAVDNKSISLAGALARAYMLGAETRNANASLELPTIQREAYATAVEKGWHEKEIQITDFLCLVHSEVSEGLESFRKSEPFLWFGTDGKPKGLATELADVIIRIADVSYSNKIPVCEALPLKMKYNANRSYRHGGKKL